jgi:hypothetical protein
MKHLPAGGVGWQSRASSSAEYRQVHFVNIDLIDI